jgi:FkbM family methyltransferase
MQLLKTIAARLPRRYQQELKRLYFARLIRKQLFQKAIKNEGEFNRLHQWVGPGDWALDVGANVGNYAARLSELVQAEGRVLALEPVPETFELLAANVGRFPIGNVTLLNIAASDRFGIQGMRMPRLDSGASNPYMAHLTDESAEMTVLSMPVDSLDIQHRIRLIKIDVEGHELPVLLGMKRLLERDRPVLIVEGTSPEVAAFLGGLGYSFDHDAGSPNRVFTQTVRVTQ